MTGAAIKWLRDEMGLIQTAAETEELAKSVPDANGVYVVPAFTGLGAPYWDAYARGAVFGLSRGTGRAHFVRATLESLAYQTMDVIKAMEEDAGISVSSLRVDGGASVNEFLMQFQADLLGGELIRPEMSETTALGAAYLAGLAAGIYRDLERIREIGRPEKIFHFKCEEKKREILYRGWKKAVKRVMNAIMDEEGL